MNAIQRILLVIMFLFVALPCLSQTIGERCDPEVDTGRDGITCQAMDEFEFQQPYIPNAKKGDVLLGSACGLIRGLLQSVEPTTYTHAGIMVRNFMEVRHSTSHQGRYREHLADGGAEGFDSGVLKYGWPGTITQTIDEVYEGAYRPDPDDRLYFLQSFRPVTCPDDIAAIFPSVVKPTIDDELDYPDVRPSLERIADAAMNINGHYRFYAYSNADLVGNPAFAAPEPYVRGISETGEWAYSDAPEGTICSSFVWSAARNAGVQVESPALEDGDREHPMEESRLGLYVYTEEERQAAGDFLFDYVYDEFYEAGADWEVFISDAANDGASQMTNCFSFDWCGTEGLRWKFSTEDQTLVSEPGGHAKDSDEWRRPGIGIAVSPDDIWRHWDSPPEGGVYGFSQPMAYRLGRFVRVHKWARSEGTGDVIVNVTYERNPVEGAEVRLRGFPPEVTDGSGQSRFVSIPGGDYELEATAMVRQDEFDIEVSSDSTLVHVPSNGVETVNLALSSAQPEIPDTRWHRSVTIDGTVFIRDDEDWPFSDETDLHSINRRTILLDPVDNRRRELTFGPFCTGGEVRVELVVRLSLNADDLSITAGCTAKLYEGASCDTDDKEDEESDSVIVPEDGSGYLQIHLYNSDEGGDESDIGIWVFNDRQNSH